MSQEARRTRRSKGVVVEALAEEALRTRRFPGLAFRGSDWNRRPWLIGTALDVWEMRATADLDLVVQLDPNNAAALAAALIPIGARNLDESRSAISSSQSATRLPRASLPGKPGGRRLRAARRPEGETQQPGGLR